MSRLWPDDTDCWTLTVEVRDGRPPSTSTRLTSTRSGPRPPRPLRRRSAAALRALERSAEAARPREVYASFVPIRGTSGIGHWGAIIELTEEGSIPPHRYSSTRQPLQIRGPGFGGRLRAAEETSVGALVPPAWRRWGVLCSRRYPPASWWLPFSDPATFPLTPSKAPSSAAEGVHARSRCP
jgi:hypothetical protein